MHRILIRLPAALMLFVWMLGMCWQVGATRLCSGERADAFDEGAGGQCLDVMLPPDVSPVWWLPLSKAPGIMAPRIQVTGIMKEQHFSPSSIEAVLAGAVADPAIPLGISLIGTLSHRVFGYEERVVIEPGAQSELVLHCGAGKMAAGALFGPSSGRFSDGVRAELHILARGDSGFQWGIATQGNDAILLRPIALVGHSDLEASIPLHAIAASLGAGPVSFVLMCPPHEARLAVRSIELRPIQAAVGGLRAAWSWNAERWRADPTALIARAEALGLQRIYVALDVDPLQEKIADAALLADFVTAASSKGIDIWAVEGDPGMVTQQGREQALRRLRALHAYQDGVPSAAQLGGVQYDIEPYLLPAYRVDPQAVAGQWARTIRALHEHSRLTLDMVLPFWLPQSSMGNTVLDALQQKSGSLTIMAYRVDPQAIQRVAEPLLAWGAVEGFSVHVALEAGRLDDELIQYYTAASAAQPAHLWLTSAEGGSVAVLLPEPVLLKEGKGYNPSGQQFAPASLISFEGNREEMFAVSRHLQPVLKAWPSYAGMVFHGLLD